MADVSPETLPTEEALSVLCRRWRIKGLSLFGSLARGDAGPASDADVLVTFQPDEHSPWLRAARGQPAAVLTQCRQLGQ